MLYVAVVCCFSLLLALHCTNTAKSVHFIVTEHLDCFSPFTLLDNSAMNILKHTHAANVYAFPLVPKNRIAVSYDVLLCQTDFQSDYRSLYFH